MLCFKCGSRIPSGSRKCPACDQVYASEYGRIPHVPGLVIIYIECPWCALTLELEGYLDIGGDTREQHLLRRRKTLEKHWITCPLPERRADDVCAHCRLPLKHPQYHEGRVYGPECLRDIRKGFNIQPTYPKRTSLSACRDCGADIESDRLSIHSAKYCEFRPERILERHDLRADRCRRCGASKSNILYHKLSCTSSSANHNEKYL